MHDYSLQYHINKRLEIQKSIYSEVAKVHSNHGILSAIKKE